MSAERKSVNKAIIGLLAGTVGLGLYVDYKGLFSPTAEDFSKPVETQRPKQLLAFGISQTDIQRDPDAYGPFRPRDDRTEVIEADDPRIAKKLEGIDCINPKVTVIYHENFGKAKLITSALVVCGEVPDGKVVAAGEQAGKTSNNQ